MKILVNEIPLWYGDCLFCEDNLRAIEPICFFTNEPCSLHSDEKCKFLKEYNYKSNRESK